MPGPSGSSRRPTWAGPSGATCWSTRSSGPRNVRTTWPKRGLRAAAFATALGSDRGQGGGPPALERVRASPPTYPADLAIVADAHGRPRLTIWDSPASRRAAGDLDRPHRRSGRRPGGARSQCPAGNRRRADRRCARPSFRNLGIHAGRASAAGSRDRARTGPSGSRGSGVPRRPRPRRRVWAVPAARPAPRWSTST